jgi:sugar-specific transcriptional regulator TrmB|tara:strand:+ start:733 stop:930 length:198 start_codon:yes stop_codon:yes gene_type:complete
MSVDRNMIEERKQQLLEDLGKVKLKYEEIEKAKLENVALQNALTGAVQQCDDFLNKLDDEVSDEG